MQLFWNLVMLVTRSTHLAVSWRRIFVGWPPKPPSSGSVHKYKPTEQNIADIL